MKKFTLIELMIVVAIIGILVTLLFPSLSRAREKAKLAVCLSNQKQISIAYSMYAVRNNGIIAWSRWYNTFAGTKGTHGWSSDPVNTRALNEFLNGPKVAWCPSDKGDPLNSWNTHVGSDFGSSFQNDSNNGQLSYVRGGFNQGTTNVPVANTRVYSLRLTSWLYPAAKAISTNQSLRNDAGRNILTSIYKSRYFRHDTKEPRYTVPYVDGHADYYDFWMKKLNGGIGADPALAQGQAALSSSWSNGTTLRWRIDNLRIY